MKITDKRPVTEINFSEIEPGGVFVYKDIVYIKLITLYSVNSSSGVEKNAAIVGNGELVYFRGATNVIKVNAELILT